MTGAPNTPSVPYRTIVIDPPWPYPEGFPKGNASSRKARWDVGSVVNSELPYQAMSLEDILALPVASLCDERGARLFLWTTNRYLPAAFEVLAAWGFEYRQTFVWHKTGNRCFAASLAPNKAEFLLAATRGRIERLGVLDSNVIPAHGQKRHSAKPEVWMDAIEKVSPGPYLEMFARSQRLGWDSWGNEALEHVKIAAPAGNPPFAPGSSSPLVAAELEGAA